MWWKFSFRGRAQDREVVGVDPRLAALVILVGLGCGLVGALYLLVLHLLQHVLWPTTWSRPAGFAILGGVGLVIGLLPRLIGEAGDVELMVDNIHVSGSAGGVKTLRALLPLSLLCIASGGAMGPEAPLVQTTGTLASTLAHRTHLDARDRRILTITGMAAGFTVLFGAPLGSALFALEILHRRGLQYYEAILPALLGSLSGYSVYIGVTGAGLAPVWQIPSSPNIRAVDLGWALLAGAVGAGLAVSFTYLASGLRRLARRCRADLRPMLGGLVLGALGLLSAYSLTFGETQIDEILHRHHATVAFFVLAALAKLAGTSVTFSTGWRGGFIIPLFFIGLCAARALHGILPSSNEAVMIAALMVATNVGVTKTVLGSTLVVTEMGGLHLLPTTLLAGVVALALTSQVGLIHTQRERDAISDADDGPAPGEGSR